MKPLPKDEPSSPIKKTSLEVPRASPLKKRVFKGPQFGIATNTGYRNHSNSMQMFKPPEE